jgi:hypothetical protein
MRDPDHIPVYRGDPDHRVEDGDILLQIQDQVPKVVRVCHQGILLLLGQHHGRRPDMDNKNDHHHQRKIIQRFAGKVKCDHPLEVRRKTEGDRRKRPGPHPQVLHLKGMKEKKNLHERRHQVLHLKGMKEKKNLHERRHQAHQEELRMTKSPVAQVLLSTVKRFNL